MEIVTVDIGGTHARFALARTEGTGRWTLSEEAVLRTAEHASFENAWRAYAARLGRPLPASAAIAVACPPHGEVLRLTNNPWTIRPAAIPGLGIERFHLVNDFAAVAHAVGQLPPADFLHVCGPDAPFPAHGVLTVLGPGTGLGVAQLIRTPHAAHVVPTEGGHIDFAPLDAIDDQLLRRLRARFRRVSVERVASGPAITDIYETLAFIEGRAVRLADDRAIWEEALGGGDALATAALERFCMILGSAAGDLALAHGACGVVLAGGLGLRLARHLPRSGFGQRFTAKGRFESMMAGMTVKIVTHPQPGLIGAAAAFAEAVPGPG